MKLINSSTFCCLIALICCTKGQEIKPPQYSGTSQSTLAYSTTSFSSLYPNTYAAGGVFLDGGAPIAKDGDNVYFIGYEPGETYGGYKTPAYEFNWTVYQGSNMDGLKPWKKWRPKKDGNWLMTEGDEAFWPAGLWVDTNRDWYTTVHIEFNYKKGFTGTEFKSWFRRIGAAKSTDKGSTWTYLGDIVTSDNPTDKTASFTGNYVDIGPGDQSLLVHDGYFYVIYDHTWQRKGGTAVTPDKARGTRIARCAISDKMTPGKWTKWYNGSWSQPALKGYDSNISFAGDRIQNISYNSYLKKYLAIGTYNGQVITAATSPSLANIQFSEPVKITDNTAEWGYYNDVWDGVTGSKNITGQSFRIYTGQAGAFSIKYTSLSLNESGSTQKVAVTPIFPSESVPDHNPGYQK